MRSLVIGALALALILSAALPAAETTSADPLPQTVRDALARYEGAKIKAEAEAAKVIFKERLKLKTDLEKCIAAETKKGNFSGAMAIKELMDTAGEEDDGVDVLGQPSVYMMPACKPSQKSDNVRLQSVEHPGLVCIEGTGGWYAYDVEAKTSTEFHLYVLMTARDSRPCNLFIDDQALGSICSQTTGSWTAEGLQWFKHGPYRLKKGPHKIKIAAPGLAPHLAGFALSPDPDLQLRVDVFTKAAAAK